MRSYETLPLWQKLAIGAFFVVMSPLILVVLFLWLLASLLLCVLVWLLWCTRGKDILFVYSDSPIWYDYVEVHIIPRIESRAVILNWSKRRHWLRRWTLAALVFRNFGGGREFNPLALYFRPFRLHQSFRFWKAFRDWKHGRTATLKQIEGDFFRNIGAAPNIELD
jgi:hypothetical protein